MKRYSELKMADENIEDLQDEALELISTNEVAWDIFKNGADLYIWGKITKNIPETPEERLNLVVEYLDKYAEYTGEVWDPTWFFKEFKNRQMKDKVNSLKRTLNL
jgi:hypothetical protein